MSKDIDKIKSLQQKLINELTGNDLEYIEKMNMVLEIDRVLGLEKMLSKEYDSLIKILSDKLDLVMRDK